MALGKEPIPNVVHVDLPTEGATPTETARIRTSFVITLSVLATPAVSTDDPNEDDEDGDACWVYVGVDAEPIDPDTIDEASDDEDDLTPSRRSVAGRISLDETPSILLPSLTKRRKMKEEYINKIGSCAATPTPNVIKRREIYPQAQFAMQPFDMGSSGNQHGLDPNLYCELTRIFPVSPLHFKGSTPHIILFRTLEGHFSSDKC